MAGLVGAAALRGAGTGVVAVALVGVMRGGRARLLAVERLVLRIDGLRCTVPAGMWLTATEVRISIVGLCPVEPDSRVVLGARVALRIRVSLD